jgi:Multiubiquitin
MNEDQRTAGVDLANGGKDKEYAIVINGELAVVPHDVVSYTEVVAIAYPEQSDSNTTYTVTFRKAQGPRHEGVLVEGQTVTVKHEGTVFNATATNKS